MPLGLMGPSSRHRAPALTPILTEVDDRLDTALACWRMSTEHPKWPYAPTLATLTGIEIQCVKRLTDGLRLLTETPAVTKTTLDIAALVKDVCESTEPERRLVDVHLTCAVDPPVVQARGSDPLFRLGLASCLQGVAALVTEAPERTIHLAVRAERSAVNAVTLSCRARRSASPRRWSRASSTTRISNGQVDTGPLWPSRLRNVLSICTTARWSSCPCRLPAIV